MINYNKLNGAIVSRETLEHIKNDPNVKEFFYYTDTLFLKAWKIILHTGQQYRVYTRKGVIW